MPFNRLLISAAICALPILAIDAQAVSLTGTITTEGGKPVLGAMLTVFNEAGNRKETVYTGIDGSYAIHTDFGGKLNVRARLANFEDATTTVQLAVDQLATVNLTLKHFASAQAESDALTASAHTAKLPWADDKQRRPFVSQCNYCHQVGNALTRSARGEEAWKVTIDRMQGYFAMLSDKEAKTFENVLARGFDGKPVEAVLDYGMTPELSHAKVEQWLVGDAMTFIHDTDVGADDKLYGTDEGHDVVWVLDRKTGKIDSYQEPDIDLKTGGMFAGMTLPIGIFTGKHGPHSMAQGKDGRIWITNALSSTLASFDPVTKVFKIYPVPGDVLYPHTIRMDQDGVVWFTNVVSNQVARFDPKTEKFKVISLPSDGFFRWVSDMLLPTIMHVGNWFPHQNLPLDISHHKFLGHDILNFPYGIDVNPKDGSVWYAKLYANKIGRIDPKTFEITEYDTPMRGPRRPRFDRNGVLWIPAFDDSGLMRFDTATRTFESYKLPVLADGEYEVPYALNVHPVTGDVWITANASDRIIRFKPATKSFISYPSPSRVTVLRDLVFTKDGKVCNSTSNLPAYGTEDGLDTFICFDPEGEDKDRALIQAAAKSK
jgi:virginiamycin B lyase